VQNVEDFAAPMHAITRLLIVFGCLALGPLVARSDELPNDTSTIESLTVEQARKLAEDFPGVQVSIALQSAGNLHFSHGLPLNGLKTLDAATARALSQFAKGPLLLNGLTTLDAETARALSDFKGNWLDLNGLTKLDRTTAEALAQFKNSDLHLNGLTRLDAETAEALAGFRGVGLWLNGLTTLDAKTAKALAQAKAWSARLPSMTTLDADTAKALAEYGGECLYLNGLTKLDADIAKVFAGFNGRSLALDEQVQFDNANMNFLAERKGQLIYIKGLNVIDADAAAALAADPNWDGQLFVTSLESPDSLAIARILAARAGPVLLRNLKKLSRKTFAALVEKEDLQIPPIEHLEFIPEPDGSNDDFPAPDGFPQPKR
jgi:hypothetical protein